MTIIKEPLPPNENNPREQKLKSLIIKTRSTYLELIAIHAFSITSEAEQGVLKALYDLYHTNTFMLNEAVKGQIKSKTGATEGKVKVCISRLIKSGALVKSGRVIGFNTAFKDVSELEQVVLRNK